VGLGLVCTAIVIGMAYVVHSFRVEAKGVEAN
jgi:multisubunit Na+/H+ antiporter MnhC subunit